MKARAKQWTVETLNEVVDAELESLPSDMRARFAYISSLIEEFGLERVGEPHVKHVRGPFWEMRMKGKDGISREILRYRHWPARRGGSRVRQEDTENPGPGDRAGPEAGEGDTAVAKVSDLHRKWMKNKQYSKAYGDLAPEFELARAVIQARVRAGLTQEQLARRMDTTQSVIARLESGRTKPSTQTLERLATATGARLRISFEPEGARP